MTTETINLAGFSCGTAKVRAFVLDGAAWIVGADIVTGLALSGASMAYRRLADDERRYISRADLALPAGKPMVAVSESGFYKLVMRSDKPEAAAFQEWVTREVLPAIRQTGGYRLHGAAPEAVAEGTVSELPDVAPRKTAQRYNPDFCSRINPP